MRSGAALPDAVTTSFADVTDIWFFGAVGQAGHHLWVPGEAPHFQPKSFPAYQKIGNGLEWERLDASALLLPADVPGDVAITWLPAHGVTVLAWWDRHVDSRPGSNAQVIRVGRWFIGEMLAAYRENFPTLVGLGIYPNLARIFI